jgi:hypothetical protein
VAPRIRFDPSGILRGLGALRSAIVAPGNVGDSLPRAVDRAAEITEAINRLTDEVAKLNDQVERALPVIESMDLQFKRSGPVLDTISQAEKGLAQVLRRTMRPRGPGETGPAAEAPPEPATGPIEPEPDPGPGAPDEPPYGDVE